jgi:hypothetical protein
MLNVIMLNVANYPFMLNVVMLNVVVPLQHLKTVQLSEFFYLQRPDLARVATFCEMLNYFDFLKLFLKNAAFFQRQETLAIKSKVTNERIFV